MIDQALLRPGRFETRLYVDLPSKDERIEILKTLIRNLKISFPEDIADVVRSCDGFSGADLANLLRRAGYIAIKRGGDIRLEDLISAKAFVRASVGDRSRYERLKALWGTGV